MTAMTVADARPQQALQSGSAALAIRTDQIVFDELQTKALAAIGIRGASPADLAVFMHYCLKTGLDPFSRQIYFIERQGKWTIQVGIEGFRVIRDRIAARNRETVEYEDTIWYDADHNGYPVWTSREPPAACRVVVRKNGHPFPGVVRFDAYAQRKNDGSLTAMWERMGDHQIEKCAEAFALRRAYPHDLGGLYIPEEMPDDGPATVRAQAERVTVADLIGDAPAGPPAPTPQQLKRAQAALARVLARYPLGEPADVAAFLAWRTGKQAADELDAGELRALSAWLDERLQAADGDYAAAAEAIWAQRGREREADGPGEPDSSGYSDPLFPGTSG